MRVKDRSLCRRPRTTARDPKKKVLVCYEGKVTERLYVNGLRNLLRSSDIVLKPGRGAGEPLGVVRGAVKQLEEERRSDPFDAVWCLLDVEAPEPHPALGAALRLAKESGISCALSNPCFELWITLHVKECNAYRTSDEMRVHTERAVRSYSSKHFSFGDIAPHIAEAKERARRLDRWYPEHLDHQKRNPWTSMWTFVQFLEDHGWSPILN